MHVACGGTTVFAHLNTIKEMVSNDYKKKFGKFRTKFVLPTNVRVNLQTASDLHECAIVRTLLDKIFSDQVQRARTFYEHDKDFSAFLINCSFVQKKN